MTLNPPVVIVAPLEAVSAPEIVAELCISTGALRVAAPTTATAPPIVTPPLTESAPPIFVNPSPRTLNFESLFALFAFFF